MATSHKAGPAGAGPLILISLLSLAAVAGALVSQHKFDMQPCPWCVLQRLIFVAVALVCIVGAAIRMTAARRAAGAIVLLLTLCGIAAALWQHFKAAASASCKLTLADQIINATGLAGMLPDVFEPRASCADAAVSLAGVPYDFWGLALFVVLLIVSLRALNAGR